MSLDRQRVFRVLVAMLGLVLGSVVLIELIIAPGSLMLVRVEEDITGHGRVVRQAPIFYRDKWHGTWTSFHDNGQILETGRYDHGQGRVGIWRTYHRNGTLESVGEFRGNMPVLIFRQWDANGNPEASLDYGMARDESFEVIPK